jgi:alkaline phosphatase D
VNAADTATSRGVGAASAFTHGVASFDPTDDGVLLWTRVQGAPRVHWTLSSIDGGVQSGEADVPPDSDGCVTVEVTGLAAASRYDYWFEAGDERSPVGRTKTLGGSGPIAIAVVCCSDVSAGWFGACDAIARDDVDVVLHLGDAIYEEFDGKRRRHLPGGASVTLDDYRARHRATRSDPDLMAMHARHPMMFVWDDHDVADNAWRHGAKAHDEDEHGSFADRLAAAATARQEWLPARLRDPAVLHDMHRAVPIAEHAELVILDTRIPGRDEHADHEGALPLDDPKRSLLGDEQRRWALERICDRSRPWSIVATAVTLSPLQLPIADRHISKLNDALPSGYAVVDGVAMCTDEWDGYPAERARITDAMRERGGGVVVVSGDVHSSWVLDVRDEAERPVAVEVVCPALTSKPMGKQLPWPARRLARKVGEGMDHCRWVDVTSNGWLRLTIDAKTMRAEWYAIGVKRRRREDAGRGELLASWELAASGPSTLRQLSTS